jgi:hypothetical protein
MLLTYNQIQLLTVSQPAHKNKTVWIHKLNGVASFFRNLMFPTSQESIHSMENKVPFPSLQQPDPGPSLSKTNPAHTI